MGIEDPPFVRVFIDFLKDIEIVLRKAAGGKLFSRYIDYGTCSYIKSG